MEDFADQSYEALPRGNFMRPASYIKSLFAVVSLTSIVAVGVSLSRSQPALGNLPSQGSVAFQVPTGFTEQEPVPGGRVWKGPTPLDATIVILEKQMEKVELPPADDQEYKDRLSKIHPLRLLAGISNYKIDTLERAQTPTGLKVSFTGSYTNLKKETIRFEKWEYYLKTGYAQIGYSARDSKEFPNREQIAQLLKGFTPSGT
jgi:hypothetical protein